LQIMGIIRAHRTRAYALDQQRAPLRARPAAQLVVEPELVERALDPAAVLRPVQKVGDHRRRKVVAARALEARAHLALVAVEHAAHAVHVEALARDALEACVQLRGERRQVRGRDGPDVDEEVVERGAGLLGKVDVRAAVRAINLSASASGVRACARTHQSGFSVSMYSLLSGAVGDDVRYVPSRSSACDSSSASAGGPMKPSMSSPELSSFSGNSTVSSHERASCVRAADGVSTNGRRQPGGCAPWRWPCATSDGSTWSCTTESSDAVPSASFPATMSEKLCGT
jgi:hypothetical protein